MASKASGAFGPCNISGKGYPPKSENGGATMLRLINGLLLVCLLRMPTVSWAETRHHDMRNTHSSAPAEEALQHATEALARFRVMSLWHRRGVCALRCP